MVSSHEITLPLSDNPLISAFVGTRLHLLASKSMMRDRTCLTRFPSETYIHILPFSGVSPDPLTPASNMNVGALCWKVQTSSKERMVSSDSERHTGFPLTISS